MKPVGRQGLIKLSFFWQKFLGCKVPQTRHRWSFSECIFICNSPVTQSWRTLTVPRAPALPRVSPGLCKISAAATRDVKRRPGSHQTLVTPILHRLQTRHQHWFSVNLSLNGFFSLIFFSLNLPQDSPSVVIDLVQDTKDCFQQIGNWFLSTGDKHSLVDINDDVSPGTRLGVDKVKLKVWFPALNLSTLNAGILLMM